MGFEPPLINRYPTQIRKFKIMAAAGIFIALKIIWTAASVNYCCNLVMG
jgi:hypothetical protein